jgi:hypothetical protein
MILESPRLLKAETLVRPLLLLSGSFPELLLVLGQQMAVILTFTSFRSIFVINSL